MMTTTHLRPMRELPSPPAPWGLEKTFGKSSRYRSMYAVGAWLRQYLLPPMVLVVGTLITLAAFLWSGPLLRTVDPTAAVLDAGLLSVLAFALVVVAASKAVATALVPFPMVEPLQTLTVWKRACLSACLQGCYFWAAVAVVIVMV